MVTLPLTVLYRVYTVSSLGLDALAETKWALAMLETMIKWDYLETNRALWGRLP